ncbi:MAG: PQQ-binding-like beta-propeller repeat protein [Thermoplasmata archaeon]
MVEKPRFILTKRVRTGNEVISIAKSGDVFFAGLKNGELRKFNSEWNELDLFKTNGQIRGIAPYGDKLFFASWDKNIYCIGRDMKVFWKKQIDAFPFGISAGRDCVAYSTNSGVIGLLDKDGKPIWEKKFEGTVECVKIVGEKIYTGTYGGDAIALDLGGNTVWNFKCNDIIKSISASDQFFIFTTATGKVFMFREEGTMYWLEHLGSPAIASACAEGLIAVGLFNNSVVFLDRTGKTVQKFEESTKLNTLMFQGNSTLITGTSSINIYQNFPDPDVEILYEIMCIGGKCGTFISAELVENCPQCGSEKIISRVVEERRFTKEFE